MASLFKVPTMLEKIVKKIRIIIWILYIISIVLIIKQLSYTNIGLKSPIIVCILAFIVSLIVHIKSKSIKHISYFAFFISLIISAYTSYNLISVLNLKNQVQNSVRLFYFVTNIYAFFIFVSAILGLISKYCFVKAEDNLSKNDMKQHCIESIFYGFSICFIINIYIPTETFFRNFTDFNFPYPLLIKAIIIPMIFWTIIISSITAVLNNKYYYIVRAAETGLLLALYIQYMFMNGSVGILDGTPYNIQRHKLEACINIIIWIILIVTPILISIKHKKIAHKLSNYITIIIGMIHVLSYAMLLITADRKCFEYASNYYDFSEQYVVGKENIVVLIIDAADNKYMSELLSNNDPVLENFNDFNIFTNTCSVYDYTNHSQLQMVTNFPFDNTCTSNKRREIAWNTPWSKEFYNRLHNAGYRVNFFNFDKETSEYVVGNIDNARKVDSSNIGIQYINYKAIKGKVRAISGYTVLPIVLKRTFIDPDDMNFNPDEIVVYSTSRGYYSNDSFKEHLNLSIGDNNKYVVFNHIDGVHAPYDNIDNFKYCLNIMNDYINELKRLGVYDDTTIIITADHGCIEDEEKDLEPATPIFMIKHAGEKHEKYLTNEAPICHSDIMATILYNADLYYGDFDSSVTITSASVADGLNKIEELIPEADKDTYSKYGKNIDVELTDEQLFGYPIEYYKESDTRTRQWFDRWYDPEYVNVGRFTVYCGFKYTGNTSYLNGAVNAKDMDEYQLPMQYE